MMAAVPVMLYPCRAPGHAVPLLSGRGFAVAAVAWYDRLGNAL